MRNTIILPDQRNTMACADVDMDIQGDYDEAGEGTPPIQYNQATEIIPDKQRLLLNLLRKQPAVLGVRVTNTTSTLVMQCHATAMKFSVKVLLKVFNSLVNLFQQSELQRSPTKSYKSNLHMDLQHIAQEQCFTLYKSSHLPSYTYTA